jgi:hypothetical protein
MKVKDLKQLLEKFDEQLPIFIQLKDERGWGLYITSALHPRYIAEQMSDDIRYLAFGDIVKENNVGTNSSDGTLITHVTKTNQ